MAANRCPLGHVDFLEAREIREFGDSAFIFRPSFHESAKFCSRVLMFVERMGVALRCLVREMLDSLIVRQKANLRFLRQGNLLMRDGCVSSEDGYYSMACYLRSSRCGKRYMSRSVLGC